jgi:hypothetical protein
VDLRTKLAAFGDDIHQSGLLARMTHVAKLIPLIGHRYLPDEPHEPGNHVFSIYRADVIYYGADLIDYFERESAGSCHRPWPDQIKYIPFWSDLVERNA